ncbi:MAG: flagellar export chaperone FliS [Phycisphaerae bacterium]|nr:flagellar export chaperone FliS [Phycisphaerae bacterium]
MPPSGIATYKENAVTTQSGGKIIILLYEGAIRFLHQAITALENRDYIEKGRLINRAINIITELDVVLNMDAGGEVAQNLRRLYRFMITHLVEANSKKDPGKIQHVIRLLENLLEGWKQITA